MDTLTEQEEMIMFHTLGYAYKPYWHDSVGGYRNWFGTRPNEDDMDYKRIISLVSRGWMQKDGTTEWGEEVYSVTDKGISYVKNLWLKRKKEATPSIGKRRYQAYLSWSEDCDVTFREFLEWLKITPMKEIMEPEECRAVKQFKEYWHI